MWWLRLGYNMIWLSGSTGTRSMDFTNIATSGTTLVYGGGSPPRRKSFEARW